MARRIRIYLFGVLIGVGISYFYFGANGNRDLDIWTPNSRVLEQLRNSQTTYSKQAKCVLDCDTNIKVIYDYMLKEGDVAFDESSPREIPAKYIVYSENKEIKAEFQSTDTVAFVTKIETELANSCSCK